MIFKKMPLKRKIGILGGSFNPAHNGHIHISLMARRTLGLDQIIWLVNPQNPLKSTQDMAAFASRMDQARIITKPLQNIIYISDFEKHMGCNHTYFTLAHLLALYGKKHDFTFIIGSDNLLQMPHWARYDDLLNLIKIAIAPRAPYDLKARQAKIACRIRKSCYFGKHIKGFQDKDGYGKCASALPRIAFMEMRRHPLSATQIRQNLNWKKV